MTCGELREHLLFHFVIAYKQLNLKELYLNLRETETVTTIVKCTQSVEIKSNDGGGEVVLFCIYPFLRYNFLRWIY